MGLSPEQVQIVKSTVPVLKKHGEAITQHFYKILIDENPALRSVFNHSNQETNHQPKALAAAVFAYATYIDDLGVLAPAVEKICQKHASLYIQPEQYQTVGVYLIRAMGDVLGGALTPKVIEAWTAAYFQLAEIMIKREDQLYKEAKGWSDWRDFRIARIQPESSVITSFYLEPVDGKPLPSYLPGRFISVMTDVPTLDCRQARQYSLSDAPNEQYYRISVKRDQDLNPSDPEHASHPGLISNLLHTDKRIGDILKVSHPGGEFFLDPTESNPAPVVLISAGVGLTPMLSILNTLVQRHTRRQISWIHGTHSTETHAFASHVQDIADSHRNIQATIFNRNPAPCAAHGVDYHYTERVNLDLLHRKTQLFLHQNTQYFVCGPEQFMKDMLRKLKSYGVPESRAHAEFFGTGGIPSAD